MQEKILNRQNIYEGRVVTLDLLDVELPDGNVAKREVIRHSGAVAICPIDGDDVILVRQFRIASELITLELPAGLLEVGEEPQVAADRELQEEIGYKARKLTPIGGFYVAQGYTSEYIHLFIGEDLIPSQLEGDADEFIEVVRMPLAQALDAIESGKINDSKTIIGLLRFARRIGR